MVRVPRGATLGEHLDGPSPPERRARVAANVRLCEAIRARDMSAQQRSPQVGSAGLAPRAGENGSAMRELDRGYRRLAPEAVERPATEGEPGLSGQRSPFDRANPACGYREPSVFEIRSRRSIRPGDAAVGRRFRSACARGAVGTECVGSGRVYGRMPG